MWGVTTWTVAVRGWLHERFMRLIKYEQTALFPSLLWTSRIEGMDSGATSREFCYR